MPRRKPRGNKRGDQTTTRFRAPSSSDESSSSSENGDDTVPSLEPRNLESSSDESSVGPPILLDRTEGSSSSSSSGREDDVAHDDTAADADDEGQPPPIEARNHGNLEAGGVPIRGANREDDDDDEGPPPMDSDSSSSSSSSSDDLPPLLHRQMPDNSSSSDDDEDEEDQDSDVPDLIHRQFMGSSDEEDSDDAADVAPLPEPMMRDPFSDDNEEEDESQEEDVSDSSIPELLGPQMSDAESDDLEDSETEAVEGTGENTTTSATTHSSDPLLFAPPVLEKGDYCLYQQPGDRSWSQGIVVKMDEGRARPKHGTRAKANSNNNNNNNKSQARKVYHIQPLQAPKEGPLVKVSDSSCIAVDPLQGGVMKFKENDPVLFCTRVENLPNLEAEATGVQGDQETAWEEGSVERVWPGENNPPVAYKIRSLRFPRNSFIIEDDDPKKIRPYSQKLPLEKGTSVEVLTNVGEWRKGRIVECHVSVTEKLRSIDFSKLNSICFSTDTYAAYRVVLNDGSDHRDRVAAAAAGDKKVVLVFDIMSDLRALKEEYTTRTLLERGIQQNSSLPFYKKLAKGSGADRLVKDFCPDFWLTKAIEAGSYDCIYWMEQILQINLQHFRVLQHSHSGNQIMAHPGRGLLHALADSPNAIKFFENWAAVSNTWHAGIREKEKPGLLACLDCDHDQTPSKISLNAVTMKDKHGQTFLHALAIRGDIRSLHSITGATNLNGKSTNPLRLWELVNVISREQEPLVAWKDNKGRTAADLARALGHHHVAHVLDRFASFCYVYAFSKMLQATPVTLKSIENLTSKYCKVKDKTRFPPNTKKGVVLVEDLQALNREYGDEHFCRLGKACALMALSGNLPILKWLFHNRPPTLQGGATFPAAKQFFYESKLAVETNEDMGEFGAGRQLVLEMMSSMGKLDIVDFQEAGNISRQPKRALSIVACAVHGPSVVTKDRLLRWQDDGESYDLSQDYWKFIMGLDSSQGFSSKKWTGDPMISATDSSSKLTSFLKDEENSTVDGKTLKRFKLSLLQDDKDLPQRLEVLNWLIMENGLQAPSVVDILLWRQCGVLKWMISKQLISLDDVCEKRPEVCIFLEKTAEKRAWLPNRSAVKSAVKRFPLEDMLCFLAVEFDDLQSLEYLISERGVSPGTSYAGWNLLHVSALFSRREIAVWLIRRNYVDISLVRAVSRFGKGPCACHIAMESGDLLLARFLLNEGCPERDSEGHTVLWYGEKSSNAEVLEWCKRERMRESFEKSISTLCKSLFRNEIPPWETIKERIIESDFFDDIKWLESGYDDPNKAVRQCNRSFWEIVDSIAFADANFLIWFYDQALPEGYFELENHRKESNKVRSFWKRAESSGNDLDALLMNGKDGLKELLARLKNEVSAIIYPHLESICSEMSTLRTGFGRDNLALPIDPLFRFLETRVQRRRSLIAISERKEELIFKQFLHDLILTCCCLLEKHLAEGTSDDLETAYGALTTSADLLKALEPSHPFFRLNSFFPRSSAFLPDGSVNSTNFEPNCKRLLSFASSFGYGCSAFGLATSKGNTEAVKWLIKKFPDLWTEDMCCSLIRLAEFCGARVEWLLKVQTNGPPAAILGERFLAALSGAAEAGHMANVKRYFPQARGALEAHSLRPNSKKALSLETPIALAVAGLYANADKYGIAAGDVFSRYFECISWIGAQPESDRFDAVAAAVRCIRDGASLKHFFNLFSTLDSNDIWSHREDLQRICTDLLCRISPEDKSDFIDWIRTLATENVSLQTVLDCSVDDDIDSAIFKEVEKLQKEQKVRWLPFKKLCSGADISSENTQVDAHNEQGLKLIHCACACNRSDVVEWLLADGQAVVGDLDKSGRTVAAVAKATDAAEAELLVQKNISGSQISLFLAACWRRKLACRVVERRVKFLTVIQGLIRRALARAKHSARIAARVNQRKRFDMVWGRLLVEAPKLAQNETNSWETLKHIKDYDLAHSSPEELAEYGETFKQLDATAGDAGLAKSDEDEEDEEFEAERTAEKVVIDDEDDDTPLQQPGELRKQFNHPFPPMDNIKITKQVLNWVRKSEQKYVDLFLKRIEQLAAGDRSRILCKNLTGSKTTIYETYLEQKKAQRILWTPIYEGKKHSILIYYVANHKHVSRLMELIDHSETRAAKKFVSAADALYTDEGEELSGDNLLLQESDILLDPQGDTPLKLHQIPRDKIGKLAHRGWEPPLRLTPEERECVETQGTVLLLGRSGTGKTLCIANRIDLEGSKNRDDPSFRQLFVARSYRICRRVRLLTDKQNGKTCTYITFRNLMTKVGTLVSEPTFYQDKGACVNFERYKREFYRETKDAALDPLVLWGAIQTIKGSIKAVQNGRPMDEDEFLNLGVHECKLSEEQRKIAYSAFISYNNELCSTKLFDDCDRVSNLLRCLKRLDREQLHEHLYSCVAVDEVQDFTQAELALFYMMSRDQCLFLAGDNAQSVVEGVDFRFEDLRKVAYELYGPNSSAIPKKPLVVNRNFRSHAGILILAAGILDRLYAAFPATIRKLPPEKGIFHGPRPGIFRDVDTDGLKSLLARNEGLTVLMHDDSIVAMKEKLKCENIILGIRDAKGLEFLDIVIVNFFSDMAEEYQKPWRELLRERDISTDSTDKYGFPQLETYLKLLYTGVTRCSRRLFFLETKPSIAGQAFFKWLTKQRKEKDPEDGPEADPKDMPTFAVNQNAAKMETVMTPDEIRAAGVNSANNAEKMEEDAAKALSWIERALRNFERVGDEHLARKARAHLRSLQIRVQLDSDFEGYELTEDNELEISKAAYACAKEGIMPELYRLVEAILPKLSELAQTDLKGGLLNLLEEYK